MAPEQVAVPLLQGEEAVQGQLQLAAEPPVVQGGGQHHHVAGLHHGVDLGHVVLLHAGTGLAAVAPKAAPAAVEVQLLQEEGGHLVAGGLRPLGEGRHQGGGVPLPPGAAVENDNVPFHRVPPNNWIEWLPFPQYPEEEQGQHPQHDGFDPPAPLFQEEGGPQAVAHQAAGPRRQAQGQQHLAVEPEKGQAREVGGEVEDLGHPVGGGQGEMGRNGEEEQEKGPRPGPVKPVVHPHPQGHGQSDGKGLSRGKGGPVAPHPLAPEEVGGGHRQDDQHHPAEGLIVQPEGQAGPCRRPRQGPHRQHQGPLPGDVPPPGQLPHRQGGAHGGAELVGADGHMGRQPRHKVGRQGDQPPAPGHRVHKPRQAGQGADQQKLRCFHPLYFWTVSEFWL